MSLKYCFLTEIHKTYNFPKDYTSLIGEIKSLFLQKLPSKFLIQYQDADGDHIVISTNQEYMMMISHELPNPSSTVKLFITPLKSLPEAGQKSDAGSNKSCSNGSFEVVEDDTSLKVEEIVDDLSLDDANKEDSPYKVVVSLVIPKDCSMKDDEDVICKETIRDQSEKSFSYSSEEKLIRNLPKSPSASELSLSIEMKEEYRPRSCTFFAHALQSEEDNFSFSNGSFRKNSKSEEEFEDLPVKTLKVPTYKEKDSQDLCKHLNNTAPNKWLERSFEENSPRYKICGNSTTDRKKVKEESQEKWVSFSTEQDDGIAGQHPQNIELQGGNFFVPKQKLDNLFVCPQEPIYKYQEEDSLELKEDEEEVSLEPKIIKNAFKVRSFEDFMMDARTMNDMLVELEDRTQQKEKLSKSYTHDFEEEIRDEDVSNAMERDVWYDAYQTNWDKPASPVSQAESNLQMSKSSDSQINFSNELSCNLDDYLDRSEKVEEKKVKENVENMNISLLSISEAKYMASAIGSINKITGFNQRVTRDSLVKPEIAAQQMIQRRLTLPSYNRWTARNYEIKVREEKISPVKSTEESFNENNKWLTNGRENFKTEFHAKQIELMDLKQAPTYCLENSDQPSSPSNSKHKLDDSDSTPIEMLVDDTYSTQRSKEEEVFNEDSGVDYREIPSESNFRDYKDQNMLVRRSMSLETFRDLEEPQIEYKFEYRELRNTPLYVKPGTQEWCVVFKTVSLKNTGNIMWTRCQITPVGLDTGSKSEVTYIAPGDSVYVTLEIFGFFKPGKYNSTWKVIHRGEIEPIMELGDINLEFEIFEKRNLGYDNEMYNMTRDCDYEEDSIRFDL